GGGGEVGQDREQVRVLALDRLPEAIVGIGDHAAPGDGVVEQVVECVGDGEDEHRGQKELNQPQRDREGRLGGGEREASFQAAERVGRSQQRGRTDALVVVVRDEVGE